MKKTTLVTGFWDIGRDGLEGHWARTTESYINKLNDLLKIGYNFIVFGDEDLKNKIPDNKNIQFIHRNLDWFNNEFFDKIQEIRTNEDWYNQSGWLPESTQAKLKYPRAYSASLSIASLNLFSAFLSNLLYFLYPPPPLKTSFSAKVSVSS